MLIAPANAESDLARPALPYYLAAYAVANLGAFADFAAGLDRLMTPVPFAEGGGVG
ncbi:hypothetical protein GCM10029992_23080 [Glycomyces albus]